MGELRQRGKGKIWWIRYYRDGRRFEESARTTNKDIARDILKRKEGNIAHGVAESPRIGRVRFEDGAADILAEYQVNGRRSLAKLKERIDLHLMPAFRARRLADLTTADVRAYTKDRLDAGAAPATVNRELAVLKRIYTLAIKAGQLHARADIPMLAEHNVRRGFLEPDQFAAVRAHLPEAVQPPLTFAYLTGWRLASEVLPLEWRHVDWTGRVVRLDPGTTKNGDGRAFPFTAAIESLLRAQQAAHDTLRKAGRIVPHVFHRDGRAILDVRGAWDAACTAAGVPGRLLHDMRRSAVRNLERDGVPRSAAMAMVGHKTESIYRRYAIVDAALLREAAEKINRGSTGTFTGTRGPE